MTSERDQALTHADALNGALAAAEARAQDQRVTLARLYEQAERDADRAALAERSLEQVRADLERTEADLAAERQSALDRQREDAQLRANLAQSEAACQTMRTTLFPLLEQAQRALRAAAAERDADRIKLREQRNRTEVLEPVISPPKIGTEAIKRADRS